MKGRNINISVTSMSCAAFVAPVHAGLLATPGALSSKEILLIATAVVQITLRIESRFDALLEHPSATGYGSAVL